MMQPIPIIVQLVHIHGPLKGEIQEFSFPEILIGRHAACNLRFPQDLVVISRKHANIIREGNRFKIVDHSTNGTFVNGKRVSEAYLKNGDVIFFTEGGPKVSFLTRVPAPSEVLPDAPKPPEAVEVPPRPMVQSVSPPEPAAPPIPQPPVQAIPPKVPTPHPMPQPQPVSQPKFAPQPSPISQPPSASPSGIQIERVRAPLVIQYGPVLQSFNELPITIGSNTSDCDLTLEHPALLEQHIQIFYSQGSYRIKDLSGRNIVLINSQPIVSPAPLVPGDKLYLTDTGPAFQFMEGGRMAEISIPQQEAPKDTENKNSQGEKASAGKKKGSLFNKLFR
jgi:pSer/pThr/pTyr-binding forkhead associated (FHA) protein